MNAFLSKTESVSTFYERISFAVLISIAVLFSYINKKIYLNFYKIIVTFVYIGFSHLIYIACLNGYSFGHFLGIIIVFIGTSYVFKHTRHLLYYVIYALFVVLATQFIAPKSDLNEIIIISLFYSIVLVRFFAFKLSKEAEKTIKGKDANIFAIIENIEAMIWSLDTDLKLITYNKTFDKVIFENCKVKLNQKKSIKEKNILNFFGEGFIYHLESSLEGKVKQFEQNLIIENTPRLYAFSITPIFLDNEEKVIGITILGNDITEDRKKNLELIEAKEKSEALAQSRQEFLANMSHEIRTPLNGIIGFTDLILKRNSIDQTDKEQLEIIKKSSDLLLILINDILDISKIEAGKLELEEINIDIKSIIEHVVSTFKAKAEEKSIVLNYHIENEIKYYFKGDSVRISQILLNLLSNSIKFTPEGGNISVNLTVTSKNDSDCKLNFEIKDTGIGIEKDKISAIFDPFVQTNKNTTRKFGGTGLGLSIVKMLVELMKGEISVTSKVNEGTTFSFSIVLKKGELLHIESNQNKSTETSQSNNYNILVAEDNPINQLLVKTVLESFGHKVTIANNGLEAIENFKAAKYDIILMDLMMPEMNGFDASKEIRAFENLNKLSPIPIMALSADVTSSELETLNKFGINDYLSKPFDAIVLKEKIELLVSNQKK